MEFDDFDGSIDDLLSDGDNFFDIPKTPVKKINKSGKAVADIFGFDKETKSGKDSAVKQEDDWLGLSDTKINQKEKISTSITKEIDKPSFNRDELNLRGSQRKTVTKVDKSSFEDDDINKLLDFSSLETKPTKKIDDKIEKEDVRPRSAAAKKASILSDLLGETKKDEKILSFDDILQSNSIAKKDRNPTPPVIAETKTQPQNEFMPTMARESRRGRRNSPSFIDPLKMFEPPKVETKIKTDNKAKENIGNLDNTSVSLTDKKSLDTKEQTSKAQPSILPSKTSGLPNWLGGSEPKTKQPAIEEIKQTAPDEETSKVPVNTENVTTAYKLPDQNMFESLLTQQRISSSHIELQNSSLALQQQESQLMIAVQLKKYEDSLAEMQRKQQEMLLKQDVQFNSLLERQFAKQQVMESNMRLQQERINNHIQVLLSQPSSNLGGISEEVSEEQQRKRDYIRETFEEHRKFYDDIINGLKQKHNEEIFLLEESYKKQMQFLENSLESTEQRLKAEIENINKHYNEKIQDMLNEKINLISQYEEKIKQINAQNLLEIEAIKENSKITIMDVRNEYKQMMDDLSQSQVKEREMLAESETISKKIDENLETLSGNTRAISELQTKFMQEKQFFSDVKQETLSVKEQEIKMMQTSLERQRASNDAERAQVLTLVRTLETKVAEQLQVTREERWSLQQAAAVLAARSAAMDREAEYVRRNLEREREEVKTLKQTLLAENESIILKLTEEKLAIVAEKSRLQTGAKLINNFDHAKAKTEIEAALQVAKEATELTDKERETLCKQQCEVELLKRNLQDQKVKLNTKEYELNKLYKSADQKYREGEKALTEAKLVEQNFNDRLKEIQKQMDALALKEKLLAEEKMTLSKERVALHTEIKKNKKCGLCEADNYNDFVTEYRNRSNINEHSSPPWGADAEILRLKQDLENDEDIVSKELSIKDEDSNNSQN